MSPLPFLPSLNVMAGSYTQPLVYTPNYLNSLTLHHLTWGTHAHLPTYSKIFPVDLNVPGAKPTIMTSSVSLYP